MLLVGRIWPAGVNNLFSYKKSKIIFCFKDRKNNILNIKLTPVGRMRERENQWLLVKIMTRFSSNFYCGFKKNIVTLFVTFIQVVEDGYEFFAKRQLVTLFSAPNYCGEFDNAGGMMSVDETLMCSFQVRGRP